MKKYPNSVIKGLLTALLFVMVLVTVLGFIVTAAALSGEVYTTDISQLRANITENALSWLQSRLPALAPSTMVRLLVFALDVVYALRYIAPFIIFAGFILTALFFCLLMRSAGHRNGAQDITLSKFDRMPFEPAAVLMIGIPVLLHLTVYVLFDNTTLGRWFFLADPVEFSIFALLLSPFVYALCHTFAVRCKSKTLWTNTLICRYLWQLPKRLFHSVKNAGRRDENGNIVYTDENGTPLNAVLPGDDPTQEPGTGTVIDPNPGVVTDPNQGGQSGTQGQGSGDTGTSAP